MFQLVQCASFRWFENRKISDTSVFFPATPRLPPADDGAAKGKTFPQPAGAHKTSNAFFATPCRFSPDWIRVLMKPRCSLAHNSFELHS
jgi:hypothetical protein